MFLRSKDIVFIDCLFIQLPSLARIVIQSWKATGCVCEGEKLTARPMVFVILLIRKPCVCENSRHQIPLTFFNNCSYSREASLVFFLGGGGARWGALSVLTELCLMFSLSCIYSWVSSSLFLFLAHALYYIQELAFSLPLPKKLVFSLSSFFIGLYMEWVGCFFLTGWSLLMHIILCEVETHVYEHVLFAFWVFHQSGTVSSYILHPGMTVEGWFCWSLFPFWKTTSVMQVPSIC